MSRSCPLIFDIAFASAFAFASTPRLCPSSLPLPLPLPFASDLCLCLCLCRVPSPLARCPMPSAFALYSFSFVCFTHYAGVEWRSAFSVSVDGLANLPSLLHHAGAWMTVSIFSFGRCPCQFALFTWSWSRLNHCQHIKFPSVSRPILSFSFIMKWLDSWSACSVSLHIRTKLLLLLPHAGAWMTVSVFGFGKRPCSFSLFASSWSRLNDGQHLRFPLMSLQICSFYFIVQSLEWWSASWVSVGVLPNSLFFLHHAGALMTVSMFSCGRCPCYFTLSLHRVVTWNDGQHH